MSRRGGEDEVDFPATRRSVPVCPEKRVIGTALAVIAGLCALALCSLLAGYAVVVVSCWLELQRATIVGEDEEDRARTGQHPG